MILSETQIKNIEDKFNERFEIDNRIDESCVKVTNRRVLNLLIERIVSSDVLEKTREIMDSFEKWLSSDKIQYGDGNHTIRTKLCGVDYSLTFHFKNSDKPSENGFVSEGWSGLIGGTMPVASVNTILYKGRFQNNSIRFETEKSVMHETNHIYQQLKSKYEHGIIMAKANDGLMSNNECIRHLSNVIYASNTTEQDAMCNELYLSVIHTVKDGETYDKRQQAAFIWLYKLYAAKKYIEANRNNPELINAVNEYLKDSTLNSYNRKRNDVGVWKYKKFKNRCNAAIEEMENKIAWAIGKALRDMADDEILKEYNPLNAEFFL